MPCPAADQGNERKRRPAYCKAAPPCNALSGAGALTGRSRPLKNGLCATQLLRHMQHNRRAQCASPNAPALFCGPD